MASAKVDLFDMQGRPVFSAKCENGTVELKGLASGRYVVRVAQNGMVDVKNVILK
jgi:endo-1,4-beta-xylanase